jgi:hypothetical protein
MPYFIAQGNVWYWRGIDDYANVDAVFNRVGNDPGPSIKIITDAKVACIVMLAGR